MKEAVPASNDGQAIGRDTTRRNPLRPGSRDSSYTYCRRSWALVGAYRPAVHGARSWRRSRANNTIGLETQFRTEKSGTAVPRRLKQGRLQLRHEQGVVASARLARLETAIEPPELPAPQLRPNCPPDSRGARTGSLLRTGPPAAPRRCACQCAAPTWSKSRSSRSRCERRYRANGVWRLRRGRVASGERRRCVCRTGTTCMRAYLRRFRIRILHSSNAG